MPGVRDVDGAGGDGGGSVRRRAGSLLRWSGTVLSVLLLALWFHSGWYTSVVQVWRLSMVAWHGELSLVWIPAGVTPLNVGPAVYRDVRRRGGPWEWWYHYDPRTARAATLMVPLWWPIVLVAAPTGVAWWRSRRGAPKGCPRCGYDLTGLAKGSRCPECGAG